MANSRQSATIFSPSSKRPTKRTRSSITEHSFQGIASSPRGGSVTYVSGTNCHPCVGSLTMNQTSLSLPVWGRHDVIPHSVASDIGKSVRAQRLYDVDARGARRRQRRRDDRGGQQNKRRGDHWRGTRHPHVQEIAARQTRQRVPGHRASDDPRGRHHGAFGDDTRQEMTRLRSKRQPDAELARAGADGEGENASDADQGNGKSDGRKDTEHDCVETIRSENFGANVFERSGPLNGWVARHVANDPRDRRDERIRICAGVDEEATAKDWTLFKW